MDSSILDEASTRKNKFELANAVTPAQKENVVRVIMTGQDLNQAQGKPRKPTLATGEVGTQIAKPTPAAVMSGVHPVIKQGSTGPAVIEWQKILGTTADGKFGPNTTTLTKNFQKSKGLVADGIVGAKSWTAALGASQASDAAAVASPTPGLMASLNPFAVTLKKQAAAVAAKNPVSAAAHAKVNATPSAKPTPKAATPVKTSAPSAASAAVAAVTKPIQVAQAGMFGALDKVPLWVKIAGVVGAVGVFVFGREAKMVNYGTGREYKRRGRAA